MIPTAPPRFALWLFGLVLRERDQEMLLGDLVEEHALVASTQGRSRASKWFWTQVAHSAAPLLWANIRRGLWLKTLGAVLGGYAAVALMVMLGDLLMSKLLPADGLLYPLISLALGIPAMILGGYLAAWMRPRAAIGLAVIAGLMGLVSLAVTGDGAPLWYQVALIVIGPAASLAGGRLRIRRRI
jgi:hypothetical protein